MDYPLNALGLSHRFIASKVKEGDFCIDATAGRGRDTAFLCALCGKSGRVLAFDIQKEAVESTEALLLEKGFQNAKVLLASHSEMDRYAAPETADAIMFNFGWLPGGNHSCFSQKDSSVEAVRKGLEILKPHGVMSVCIYYGKENGFDEKNALTDFFKTLDPQKYTVIYSEFFNRSGNPPIPVFILKEN